MKYLIWLLKAAIFFTLFAFALNNQQAVAVYFFFGALLKAPLVLVVLVAFSCGLALGVLVMMPRWWKRRKKTLAISISGTRITDAPGVPVAPMDNTGIPRHGL